MNAWMVAGRRASVPSWVRSRAPASPVRPGLKRALNCIITRSSEGELRQGPSLAFGQLESENARNGRCDVVSANRAIRSCAGRYAGTDRDEPDAPAGLVTAAMVCEAVAGDVAVPAQLGHDEQRRA